MSAPLLSAEARASAIRSIQETTPVQWLQSPRLQKRIARVDEAWRGNAMNKLKMFRNPPVGFSPGRAIRQNRFNEHGLTSIPTFKHKSAGATPCQNPVAAVEQDQIKLLDPTGQRTALFAKKNPRRVKPGDILHVRLKNGDPFSGVCINIRQRHAKVDWAILLRNHVTRIPTEMWFKIYSPNIEGIEIVQRAQRRARRVRLYYMRKPKHDMGSVDGIVRQYMRSKTGLQSVPSNDIKTKSKKKKKAKTT